MMATGIDEISCGICLNLFSDPRTLPCLHTFCRECLERELNGRETLKCPVCRAKHDLTQGVALLPVDEFALQELPLKKLQNASHATSDQNCESCGESRPPVAWCDDCKSFICEQCLAQHQKMVGLRRHNVVQSAKKDPGKKATRVSLCLRHSEEQLKYYCKRCQEAVCRDCLLLGHKDHEYSAVADARVVLREKLVALAKLISPKKKEFEAYLVKLKKVETTTMESTELMKMEIDKIFDAIIAAVENQRNKALKTVSQGLKEIWAQKELMEVRLAQLDSFAQFANRTEQCSTDSSYVAMATQGMKLMEQLKDCHGNESTLERQLLVVGSQSQDGSLDIPLKGVFQLSQKPTVKLTPPEGSKFKPREMKITLSLEVGGLQVSSMTRTEGCELRVEAWLVSSGETSKRHWDSSDSDDEVLTSILTPEVRKAGFASWIITVPSANKWGGKYRLKYKLTGAVEMEDVADYHNSSFIIPKRKRT